MSLIQDASKAQRLARAIAADIALHHEAKIIQGMQQDTFFELMAAEFNAGHALYTSRVVPNVDPKQHHYWCAIIDVILAKREHVSAPLW